MTHTVHRYFKYIYFFKIFFRNSFVHLNTYFKIRIFLDLPAKIDTKMNQN